jgi:small conductance mechanosensitive channel
MEEFHKLVPATAVEYGGRILGALVLLVVGWWAVRMLVGPLRRLLERSHIDPSVASFLANSARAALVVVILLAALQQLGMQTASLLTLVGTVGLAVALSLQGSLANFASGLLVLSFRMIRVGDTVEIGDVRGEVTDLLPFHVVLVTADNQRVTVPNTTFTSSPVRNHSALGKRRVQWTLPLTATDDVERIKSALRERLQAETRILPEPAPQMFVQEWTDSKRTLAVQAWVRASDFGAMQQELLEELGKQAESQRRKE